MKQYKQNLFSYKKLVIAVAIFATAIAVVIGLSQNPSPDPRIRRAPYPYQAMLAICSDIDGSTLREFIGYHRFLNTLEETPWGQGLGLDIGDSYWMFTLNNDTAVHDYDGSSHENIMTYFDDTTGTERYAKEIAHFFAAGWIDSMHSFGDFSQVLEDEPVYFGALGEMAFNSMEKDGIVPSVWINHGNGANIQNVRNPDYSSKGLDYQQGGNPDSEHYHTGYTVPGGLKYFWFSKPWDKFSQSTPLFPVQLEDGQRVWGFKRYTGEHEGFWILGAHEYNWSIYNLHEQLSQENLDKLVADQGIAVVAQHMGTSNGDYIFPGAAVEAFRLLADYEKNNDILVARTSRLLEFVRIRDHLNYTYEKNGSTEIINILTVDDPVLGKEQPAADQLKGISFNVDNAAAATILLNGAAVDEELLLRSTAEDQQVVGFKWYEKDVTDYSVQ